jgi:hypothetical protein
LSVKPGSTYVEGALWRVEIRRAGAPGHVYVATVDSARTRLELRPGRYVVSSGAVPCQGPLGGDCAAGSAVDKCRLPVDVQAHARVRLAVAARPGHPCTIRVL